MSDTYTWVTPAGAEHLIPNVLWDIDGRFGVPANVIADSQPLGAGSVVRTVRDETRSVAFVFVVRANDAASLRQAVRQWVNRFRTNDGDGRLRVNSPDGAVRDLRCRAEVRVPETAGRSTMPTWQRVGVILTAHDPYWESVSQRSFAWGVTGVTSSFLPLGGSGDYFVLGDSALLVAESIVNDGDVDTWPVWTISGPVTDFTLTNSTTGDSLVFDDLGLLAGESVQIDTRPGVKTVVKSDGTSLFSSLSSASALGALVAGGNDISVTVTGGTGSTGLALAFRERWLTP